MNHRGDMNSKAGAGKAGEGADAGRAAGRNDEDEDNPGNPDVMGKKDERDLFRLTAAQILVHSSMSGLRLAAPLLALGLDMGTLAAGLAVAFFAIGQGLAALPAGRLADRRGMRMPVVLAILLGTTGAALAALWPVYWVLCGSAILSGSAVCLIMVAVQRHAGRVAKSAAALRRAYSWVSLSPAAANFLGPFAGGILIDLVGFRWTFAVMAGAAACAWLLVRKVPEAPREPVDAARPPAAWGLWRDPVLRRVLLLAGVVSGYWDVHAFMVPVVGHDRGLSASVIGSILGAFSFAATTSRAVMPFIAARLSEWVLLTFALAATGVVFIAYPWMPNAWTMGACSVLLGATLGSVQPMMVALLHHATPPSQRGQALALRMLMINASSVSTPLLMGSLGGLLGIGPIFFILGAVAIACAPLATKFRDTVA